MPLPRFAALRSDEVNFRTGPGTRYPIDWVYKRRDLPVQIEREFEVWRLVRDPEGDQGLGAPGDAGAAPDRRRDRRRAGAAPRSADDDAGAGGAAEAGRHRAAAVSCEATSDWCQAQVQDYRGWIKRTEIWGTFPGEAIQ